MVSIEVRGFQNGGIGSYVLQAAQTLAARGHEVWLVTYLPDGCTRDDFARLPGFARVVFVEDCPPESEHRRFGLARAALRFAQLAHEKLCSVGVPFDYIEFADYGATGAVAIAEHRLFGSHGDAVLAVALHSPTYECWQHNETMHLYGPTQREVAALEHEAIRTAPVLWSPSRRLRDDVCKRLGRDPASVPIVRYPLHGTAAPPPPPAARRRLEDLTFLYCGRIEPRKGVRELVAAFAQLPQLEITCYGRDGATAPPNGSEVAYLQQRAGNVHFAGDVGHDELQRRIAAADVVILPSRWDNWPNTCIEAMSQARVVIGGDRSGMAEMIEHGVHGFLCRSGDADDLVRVVRDELGGALDRLPEIGRAAARRAQELGDPQTYAAAIEGMVATHRGTGRWPATAASRSRVSILLPYYREGRELLGEAVGSALAQTHEDFEVLLTNDGSPRADAAALLAEQAARDPRIRVLHKQNGGVASARNHAIERADGDFFVCLDADNRLRPDYLATGLEVLSRSPGAVAMVPRFQVFEDGAEQPGVVVQCMPYDRPLALFRNTLGDAGAMFRREVFHQHGLRYDPDVDCYSDWALWLDLARLGLRVQTCPRVLYDYRSRYDSMMAEQAKDHHLALVGLLIQRHLPDGDEREMLVALTHGWGVGSIVAALSPRHEDWEQPLETVARLEPRKPASQHLQAAFEKLRERRPMLGGAGAGLIRFAARLHGKWKGPPRPRG
jgi:glycosyltransferase involved in cell wall biosynthesis/GT2 family glycosyltransferase